MYLRAIQCLTVLDKSLDRRKLYDETDDTIMILYPSVRKLPYSLSDTVRQEGDIVLSQAADAKWFSFRGIELMPHLETIEIKSCPSKTHTHHFKPDISMKVGEEYQLGKQRFSVISHYAAWDMVDWDRPMVDIAKTSSYVKSIQVEKSQKVQTGPQTVFIDRPLSSRLQHLEVFEMDGTISCDEVLELLRACRSLRTLDVTLYPSDEDGYPEEPDNLLALLAISPLMIEDVSIRDFPLEWLPYFRYCENLSLETYEGFKPNRPGVPRIEWSTHEPPTIERLDLQILDVYDEDVPAISDFIRCHTAVETRIKVCDLIEDAPVPREGRWGDAFGRSTSNPNANADSSVSDEAET